MELDHLALAIHDQAVLLLLDLADDTEPTHAHDRLTTLIDMCFSARNLLNSQRATIDGHPVIEVDKLTEACRKCLLDKYRPYRPDDATWTGPARKAAKAQESGKSASLAD